MEEKGWTDSRSCATRNWPAIRFLAACLDDLSIAPNPRKEYRRVRITHPFHPLKDRQFELIEHRRIFGASYVYFHDDCGQLREIPAVLSSPG